MPGEAENTGALNHTLARYLLLRMVLGLLLLGLALAQPAVGLNWVLLQPRVLAVVGSVTFSLWAISAWGSARYGDRPWFIWSQLGLDAVLAAVLTTLSAGPRSGLYVVYLSNILAAGALLPPSGALLVACLDVGVFLLSAGLGISGWLPQLWSYDPVELSYEVVIRVFGLFLVGALISRRAADLAQVKEERSVLLDQLRTGVLITDEAGLIRSANPEAVRLLGDVEGRPVVEVLQLDETRWEQDVTDPTGAKRSLLCSRSPTGTGELILVEDLTVMRHMQAAVAREERFAAGGRIAAALAHEIRNPLAGLSGAVQLLAEDRPDPLFDIAQREVRRINELVEEMLDQARPHEVKPIVTDPTYIIEDVATAFRGDMRYRDRISVQIDASGVAAARIDPGRFRQVLWNLLLNAAQAMPEMGTIKVSAGVLDGNLEVVVSDTGIGMSEDTQRRIFDPFFTTRSGGTGLGLAAVDRIMRGHGGRVLLRSEPGSGSTFTLIFPLGDEAAVHGR